MIKDAADYLRKTRRGAMFILDGPSGSGKNAIIEKLMAADKNLKYSISVTTRAMREGEVEGNPYYFVSEKEYDKLLADDAFYEHVVSDYGGKRYGTLRSEVDSFLTVGQDVIFELDFPGLIQMKGKAPEDVVSIGILPPSIKQLKERLVARGDKPEVIAKRMEMAITRLAYISSYDYVVINDKLEESVAKLQRVISGERMKRVRQIGLKDFMKQLLEEAKEILSEALGTKS